MGFESLQCPNCGAPLNLEAVRTGRMRRCPKCGSFVDAGALGAAAAPAPAVAQAPAVVPTAQSVPDPDTRECPVCRERIKTQAIKCRFCGADLATAQRDRHLQAQAEQRAAQEQQARAAQQAAENQRAQMAALQQQANANLSCLEIILVFIPAITCFCPLVGFIWMLQGKPKGWKMFFLSGFVSLVYIAITAWLQYEQNSGSHYRYR